VDGQIEVYTDPSGPDPSSAHRTRQDCGATDSAPLVIAATEVSRVAVSEFLP
jgi:hypothetical protein